MKNNIFKVSTVYIFILLAATLVMGNQNSTNIPESESLFENYKALADKITFPEIPETNLYRLGVTVDETILDNAEKVTRKSNYLGGGVAFTDKQWIGGSFDFSARYEIPNPKKSFLFWKRPKVLHKGELNVRIVSAPSAKAAYEYLLRDASHSNMPIEAIAAGFDERYRIHELGTLSYNQGHCSRFIRDNIAVIIDSHGEFEDQVVDIAKKIDAKLLKQPLLTYEQLKARCPQVTFTHTRHPIVREQGRTAVKKPDDIFCDISVPEGVNYLIRKPEIDGTGTAFKHLGDRKHFFYDDRREDKTKPIKVEMAVVTDELLVTRATDDLEIVNKVEEK